jgi:hypothetical protein
VLIPHERTGNNAVFDQRNELVLAGVGPTELLTALVAVAEAPGVSREPGVFESGCSGVATPGRAREGYDLKPDPNRVGKSELILTIVLEAIAFAGDTVQAPGAEPILASRAQFGKRPRLEQRFSDSGHQQIITDRGWQVEGESRL